MYWSTDLNVELTIFTCLSNVKNIVNSTFRSVQLRISYFTTKPLNGICKDTTADHEKSNVIYKYRCHCESVYVGRTSQRFCLDSCLVQKSYLLKTIKMYSLQKLIWFMSLINKKMTKYLNGSVTIIY